MQGEEVQIQAQGHEGPRAEARRSPGQAARNYIYEHIKFSAKELNYGRLRLIFY